MTTTTRPSQGRPRTTSWSNVWQQDGRARAQARPSTCVLVTQWTCAWVVFIPHASAPSRDPALAIPSCTRLGARSVIELVHGDVLFHAPRAELGEELRTNRETNAQSGRQLRTLTPVDCRTTAPVAGNPRDAKRLAGGRSYNRAVAAVVTLTEFKLDLFSADPDPDKCRPSRELLNVQVAILVLVDLFKSIPEVVEKYLATADAGGLKQRRRAFWCR